MRALAEKHWGGGAVWSQATTAAAGELFRPLLHPHRQAPHAEVRDNAHVARRDKDTTRASRAPDGARTDGDGTVGCPGQIHDRRSVMASTGVRTTVPVCTSKTHTLMLDCANGVGVAANATLRPAASHAAAGRLPDDRVRNGKPLPASLSE